MFVSYFLVMSHWEIGRLFFCQELFGYLEHKTMGHTPSYLLQNPPAVDSAFHVPPVVALAEPDFTAHNPDVPDPCSQCQLAHIDKQKQTGPPQPCPRPLEGEGLAPWHCPPECTANGGKSRCDLALCPCCYGLSPQPIPHPSHPLCPPAG